MGWLIVLLTTMVQAIATFGILTYPVLAPTIAPHLNLPSSAVGYQISLAYFWAVVTSVYCGPMIQRWGAGRTTQLSMFLVSFGCVGLSFPNIYSILVGSTLIGFSYGMTNPAASHLLVKYSNPARRNLIFSIKQTGVPIGGVLAGLLSPVIAVHWGWQWATGTVAICAFIFAVSIHPLCRLWDGDKDPGVSLIHKPLDGFMMIWNNRPLRNLIPTGFLLSVIQMCLVTFLVVYLVEEIFINNTNATIIAGLMMALVQVSGVCGRLIWGWVADRFDDGWAILIVLSFVIAILTIIMVLIDPSWPMFSVYIIFIAIGLSALGWNGVYLASIVGLIDAKQVGKVTGASLAITYGGVFVGPAIFSSLYPLIGSYGQTYGLLAAVSLLSGYCVYRSRRLKNQT
jgi:MFS family permease